MLLPLARIGHGQQRAAGAGRGHVEARIGDVVQSPGAGEGGDNLGRRVDSLRLRERLQEFEKIVDMHGATTDKKIQPPL